MKYHYKIYVTLLISFFLLLFALLYSHANLQENAKVLKYLDKDQIKLDYYAHNLNDSVKNEQTYILQLLLLNKSLQKNKKNLFFQSMQNDIIHLQKFTTVHSAISDDFSKLLSKLNKRVYAYKLVENSINMAQKRKDNEDLLDAVMGFNEIAKKFSSDTESLIELANATLYEKIYSLEHNNTRNAKVLLFMFFLASVLIFFAFYKFQILHAKLKTTQELLIKYNQNLEKEVEKKAQEIQAKIYTNAISSLPNRNKLLEDASLHNFGCFALLNIDKFQSFNDVYGEEIGNIALKFTGEFLKERITTLPVNLYHIGGDEFAIVCTKQKNNDNQVFIQAIENILKAYRIKKFQYQKKTFQFMMSAGITFSGKDKMLAYADMALKDAKKRNIQLSIFKEDKKLEKIYTDDIECHKKLKAAIERDDVISYFQPIVPIQDPSLPKKYESLVRLKEEDGKVIPPFNFLNVAKAHRIYYKITKIVLRNSLKVISKYKIPVSINISMTDIQNKRTMKYFFETITSFDDNELITIELLETEDFDDYTSVYDFCNKVRSYGIKIALDDFGSGYANFSHILNLPVDFIKIDASLISNIDKNEHSKIMVETIVSLAKKIGVATIAEFVSSESILRIVTQLGVDYAQGFHIGKPLRIEEQLGKRG